jgi:hypothetical protein
MWTSRTSGTSGSNNGLLWRLTSATRCLFLRRTVRQRETVKVEIASYSVLLY